MITRADRARDSGQFELALRLYREVLGRNPSNPPIWVQYGHVLKELGQRQAAEAAYRRAISFDRHAADPYLQLGHVLKLQGRSEEAQSAYLQALLIDRSLTDSARELAALGWSEMHLSQLPAVDPATIETARGGEAGWLWAFRRKKASVIMLADRARETAQWELAARFYRKALDRNPRNPPIWVQYGHALKESANLAGAETAYRRAIGYDPQNADSYLQLGYVLQLRSRKEEAEAAYLRAFALDPSIPHPLRALGGLGWSAAATAELLGMLRGDEQPRANATYDSRFDAQSYVKRNPDVAESGMDPLAHFLEYGLSEGRTPNADEEPREAWSGRFPAKWYIARNPDVAASGMDPLEHFLRFGLREGRAPSAEEESARSLLDAKRNLRQEALAELHAFFAEGGSLQLPAAAEPTVSILLVVFNEAELTFRCLRSLAEIVGVPAELIIVDNASSDDTGYLLDRLKGPCIIRNAENLHFLRAANQAAAKARGRALLLINSDASLKPGALQAGLETLDSAGDVGAVGGKLILPDGTLQEAGSIIWNDGTCAGYGRSQDPDAPEFQFRRDVDYCSGAYMLLRRDLFERLGGFDTAFAPAYYEETDLCMRIRNAGYRVCYDPRIEVLHYEFASSAYAGEAFALMRRNHKLFVDRHRPALLRHHLAPDSPPLLARAADRRRPRLLLIEDLLPIAAYGAGFPRTSCILTALHKSGCFITYYPVNQPEALWTEVRANLPIDVEFMVGRNRGTLCELLEARVGYYDAIIVCRPNNMEFFAKHLEEHPAQYQGLSIVYDAEALYSPREAMGMELAGSPMTAAAKEMALQRELDLTRWADAVIAVNASEAGLFKAAGHNNVYVLGNAVEPNPTNAGFEDRQDFLFVGRLDHDSLPNTDALFWFINEVMPHLDRSLGRSYRVLVAGITGAQRLQELTDPRIVVLGRVEDLTEHYRRARVFIAPTRFAAGIPLKIHETAARGLPAVATGLLATQLGWKAGTELLVGDTPYEFATQCARLYRDRTLWHEVREAALARITAECDPARFDSKIVDVLRSVGVHPPFSRSVAPRLVEADAQGIADPVREQREPYRPAGGSQTPQRGADEGRPSTTNVTLAGLAPAEPLIAVQRAEAGALSVDAPKKAAYHVNESQGFFAPGSKYRIAVAYLAWIGAGAEDYWFEAFHRFLASYEKFPSGKEASLYIIYNGFETKSDLDRATKLFSAVNAQAIKMNNPVLDLEAYRIAANEITEARVCFLNTYSELLVPQWLDKLAFHLDRPEVGLVGATGSFESLPDPQFPPFPNTHLRSNGFMIDRELFRSLLADTVIRDKRDTYLIESGPVSLTRKVLAQGLNVMVVGRNGRGYPPKWWPSSDTFRQSSQQNLLIGDNHTRTYMAASWEEKRILLNLAWGSYVDPCDALALLA
jgi:GT2 family glycosyltransferase/tetratricopeptide (TPR) repeat protein